MQVGENINEHSLSKENINGTDNVPNHSSNYEVEDDLENFLFKVDKENDYLSHPLLQKKQNEKDQFIKPTHNQFYSFRNILNILSLILLLIICISPIFYYTIISKDIQEFYDFLQQRMAQVIIFFINFE